MKVSVIVPVYFNEGTIKSTCAKIHDVLLNHEFVDDYEIILIDDGSKDNSFNEMMSTKSETPDVIKIIKLTRNFGQISAMNSGYRYSTGDCVINISADLQDPPDLIGDMIDSHIKGKIEVVIGSRLNREDGPYRKFTSMVFYNLMRSLTFQNMPKGGFDFVLLSRRVVQYLLENNESNAFWQGKILWSGFSTKVIPYTRKDREIGISRWTLRKKIKYFLDGVFAYSYFPVRLMSILGLGTFLIGFVYAAVIGVNYLFGNVPFKGWAPLMILMLVLSGLQMLMLGIIGEYLWRTLDQVRGRPDYIVDRFE